jgi:hypothetical protein
VDNNEIEGFFEDVARRYRPIGHTELRPRFCRFDMEELAGKLRQDIDLSEYCLLMEAPTGKLFDNGYDGHADLQDLAFWVVKNVQTNNFDQERQVLADTRRMGRAIIRRIHTRLNEAQPFDLNTVTYDKVGPVFGNAYGYRYAFVQDDSRQPENDDQDWEDG